MAKLGISAQAMRVGRVEAESNLMPFGIAPRQHGPALVCKGQEGNPCAFRFDDLGWNGAAGNRC